MHILITSSEAVPFSKTGGLGDVATALANSLATAGHDVLLVIPDYVQLRDPQEHHGYLIEDLETQVSVPMGSSSVTASLRQAVRNENDPRIVLVHCPLYFDRPGLYGCGGRDFGDNFERFAFFSRAVLATADKLNFSPDIVHANDWQTALVPALLHAGSAPSSGFPNAATVMTIHNLAFQGVFPAMHWEYTGLPSAYFNYHQLEYFDQINFLKGGIATADIVTTVSPTYAQEIRTEEYGCGLQSVLHSRSDSLVGILNGIDVDEWNPKTDQHLPAHFDSETWFEDSGKPACKWALQREMGLPTKRDQPLFGMITRLTDQKGVDLVVGGWQQLAHEPIQLCVLGSGDSYYEQELLALQTRFPDRVAVKIGFDEALAHRIEAGADVFLMPSRFEPCGLNQMYSQRYGTLPLVRSVGGLADTVVDATPSTLVSQTATGFRFHAYELKQFIATVQRALQLYAEPQRWRQVVRTAMQQDVSWQARAQDYANMYQRALAKKRA